MKKEQGITLIALVITIIVLLILAGASIALVVGENGILNQATNAVNENEKAEEGEKVKLAAAASVDTNDLKVKEETLREELDKSFGNGNYDLVAEETGDYRITITSSGRQYKVDSYGNVTLINSDEDSVNGPSKITIEGNNQIVFDIYARPVETTLYAYDENGLRLEESEIKWTSSDTNIATVNEEASYGEGGRGLVWAYMPGTVTIRATSVDNENVYGEITITVLDANTVEGPTSITIQADNYSVSNNKYIYVNDVPEHIYYGDADISEEFGEITLRAYDENGDQLGKDEVEWTSSTANATVETGDNGEGLVWMKEVYNLKIKATSKTNPSVYTEVVIELTFIPDEEYSAPTSISINLSSTTINKGTETNIDALDEDGYLLSSYDIVWESSDENIATVYELYEGATIFMLQGIQTGTVTLTARSIYNSSVYDTITITVVE